MLADLLGLLGASRMALADLFTLALAENVSSEFLHGASLFLVASAGLSASDALRACSARARAWAASAFCCVACAVGLAAGRLLGLLGLLGLNGSSWANPQRKYPPRSK